MTRPRVAVVHPQLALGGSETKAMWALEALKHDYEVSLVTTGKVDLPRLNRCYGTKLDPREFSILQVPLPLGLRRTREFAALRGSFIQRFLKRVAPGFDVMISAYNPCDFGVPGIQFIADFSFVEEWRLTLHPTLRNWGRFWYADSPLRRAYLRLCNLISPSNPNSWKHNLAVANSNWSATLLHQKYGIEAPTLYPPVAEDFPAFPYVERENGFVCVGRVVPEKRMDTVIEILQRVRDRGLDVHLHILGGIDNSPYGKRVKLLGSQHRDWVFLEGEVFQQRKKELMVRHRYGINACQHEAFGIGVAEMVKAGCIVFVPNGGGQIEIVNHPALIYEDDDDAVKKIESVLENAPLQDTLRTHLCQGAQRFSTENFKKAVRDLVFEFLNKKRTDCLANAHKKAAAPARQARASAASSTIP